MQRCCFAATWHVATWLWQLCRLVGMWSERTAVFWDVMLDVSSCQPVVKCSNIKTAVSDCWRQQTPQVACTDVVCHLLDFHRRLAFRMLVGSVQCCTEPA